MSRVELINKAKSCKSVDEIISLAKDNNIQMSKKEAEAVFNKTHQKEGQLSDEELDNVAGGLGRCGNGAKDPYEDVRFQTKEEAYFIFEIGQEVQEYTWESKSYTTQKKIDNRKIQYCVDKDGSCYYQDLYHTSECAPNVWNSRSDFEKPQ